MFKVGSFLTFVFLCEEYAAGVFLHRFRELRVKFSKHSFFCIFAFLLFVPHQLCL